MVALPQTGALTELRYAPPLWSQGLAGHADKHKIRNWSRNGHEASREHHNAGSALADRLAPSSHAPTCVQKQVLCRQRIGARLLLAVGEQPVTCLHIERVDLKARSLPLVGYLRKFEGVK